MKKKLNKKKNPNKTQQKKSTSGQSHRAFGGGDRRQKGYFWMISTVGALLHALLSLQLSKAWRRLAGSHRSCVISSQLKGLLLHKKVCTSVHAQHARLLRPQHGTGCIKAGSSRLKAWESSRSLRGGRNSLLLQSAFHELQGKDSEACCGKDSTASAECSCLNQKDSEQEARRSAASDLMHVTNFKPSVFVYLFFF